MSIDRVRVRKLFATVVVATAVAAAIDITIVKNDVHQPHEYQIGRYNVSIWKAQFDF